MNPTHETGNNPAQTRAFGENFLADLFTDKDRSRAWIASATGTAAQQVPGPTHSPVLGLPMSDADRRRYALREAGYTGWVDADGYARTDAEATAWDALMRGLRDGYLPGKGGGWVLTEAGRRSFAQLSTAEQFDIAKVLSEGVSPEHLMDSDWDGEALVEWLSDQDADDAEGYGERLAERCLAQAETADAAEATYVLTDVGRAALDASVSTAPVDLVTETDDETTTRVLLDAATYLERHGWIQGVYYDATSGSFTPAACLVGAIGMVCYGGPVDAPAQHFDDPGFLDFEAAVLHLDRYLLAEDSSESYEFNDAKGRRLEDVLRVLRDAATRPAHELIDALKAIDRQNADTAALAQLLVPSGAFAGTGSVEQPVPHVDYPHFPGTLYDWPACESECNCYDGSLGCVYCALGNECALDGECPQGDAQGGDAE